MSIVLDQINATIASISADVRLRDSGFAVGYDAVNELVLAERTATAYAETDLYLRSVAKFYKIGFVGDLYRFRDGVEIDLQFPGVVEAVTFAKSVLNDSAIEDARFPNPPSDLLSPVTLTVRFGSASPLRDELAPVIAKLRTTRG